MKYVLRGTIVTFDSNNHKTKKKFVCIDGKKIVSVVSSRSKLPAKFKNTPAVDVDGFIYPGLIDLHNHIAYNFLNLWGIKRPFKDRYQWPTLNSYKKEISVPTKLLALTNAADLVKYSETKALVGGVTSIQGYSKFKGSYSAWLLRNVENEPFGKLEAPIYQSVMKLKEQDFEKVANVIKNADGFIYHLAEGVPSKKLESEYTDLDKHNLISDKLIAIHCNGLQSQDWQTLGEKNVKMVWSPLSNFLLYGNTADVASAKNSKVLICLGSDWSPTGSKSLLWELKVADLYNKQNHLFTDQELVEMVTINPAKAIAWDDKVGKIMPGYYADLVIFDHVDDDPYRNLILATEKNLQLSVIDGRPRYGDVAILSKLGIKSEKITIDSRQKGIDLLEPDSPYGDLTLTTIQSNLKNTLSNPAGAAKKLLEQLQRRIGVPLQLLIEDEDNLPTDPRRGTGNTVNDFLKSVNPASLTTADLDSLTMYDDDDFFNTLNANDNVPDYLFKLNEYLS